MEPSGTDGSKPCVLGWMDGWMVGWMVGWMDDRQMDE